MPITYAEKLLDPRWQKKRLQVLQRENFTCQLCKDTKTTLHIHHIYYADSGNPWDVDHTVLMCLCKHCHSVFELTKSKDYFYFYIKKEQVSKLEWRLYYYYLDENSEYLFDVYAYNEKTGKSSFIITLNEDKLSFMLNQITKDKKLFSDFINNTKNGSI